MTITPERRTLLPLAGPHGSRSWATCHYRCGNACDQPEPNTSGNDARLHRHRRARSIAARCSRGAARSAPVRWSSAALAGPAAAAAATGRGRGTVAARPVPSHRRWTPVAPNVRDTVTVPDGYRTRRGRGVGRPGAARRPGVRRRTRRRRSPRRSSSATTATTSACCRWTAARALLVVNHEYTNEELMFPAGAVRQRHDQADRDGRRTGMSVLEIERRRDDGLVEACTRRALAATTGGSPATTPFTRRRPGGRRRPAARPPPTRAAGRCSAPSTTAPAAPRRGARCCPARRTSTSTSTRPARSTRAYAASYARYGITGTGSTAAGARSTRASTWPASRTSRSASAGSSRSTRTTRRRTPRKHTMLGRFKHEGANIHDRRRRARGGLPRRRRARRLPLQVRLGRPLRPAATRRRPDKRNLHAARPAARCTSRGSPATVPPTGSTTAPATWIPLTSDTTSYVAGMSVADVLIDTRLAADRSRPTRMDRPEDVEPNPVNGRIYAALTNNSNRGTTFPVDEANPIGSSKMRTALGAPLTTAVGQPERLRPRDQPRTATTTPVARSRWVLLLVCGDPEAPETYFGGFPKDQVSPISCPDNVAFDAVGNLWISTDGNAARLQRRAVPGAGRGPRARAGRAVPHRAGRRRVLRPAGRPGRQLACSPRSSTPARAAPSTGRPAPGPARTPSPAPASSSPTGPDPHPPPPAVTRCCCCLVPARGGTKRPEQRVTAGFVVAGPRRPDR